MKALATLAILVLISLPTVAQDWVNSEPGWNCLKPEVVKADLTKLVTVQAKALNLTVKDGSMNFIQNQDIVGGALMSVELVASLNQYSEIQIGNAQTEGTCLQVAQVVLPPGKQFTAKGMLAMPREVVSNARFTAIVGSGNKEGREGLILSAYADKLKPAIYQYIASTYPGATASNFEMSAAEDYIRWRVDLKPVSSISVTSGWITLFSGTTASIKGRAQRGSTPYQWENAPYHAWSASITDRWDIAP